MERANRNKKQVDEIAGGKDEKERTRYRNKE